MPDTSVKYFDSTMSGAAALSGTAGTLIGVLDACLVNGFGSVTLTSLVVASNVATATVSGGHGFAMVGTVGPVVRIAGATPSGLNGDWRLASVPNSTTFTFATTGISDQTATGMITAKRAPAGFSKAFTGTNKAAYRADALSSTRLYLRIDDTGTTSATAIMYEAMTAVDTGTGLSPTSGSVTWAKGSSQPWAIFADDRAVYLLTNTSGVNGMFFGDISSVLSPDPYGAALIGSSLGSAGTYLAYLNSATESYLARTWTGIGAAVALTRSSLIPPGGNAYLGQSGSAFPNPPNHAFHAMPVQAFESGLIRGTMPGLWNPLHPAAQLPHQLLVPLTVNNAARVGMLWKFVTTNAAAFDLTGPWR